MSRAQRFIGWLACMTVTVCSVGVPLPAQSVKKSGVPFPCQYCACGCKDAENCWRSCCCHTNREKLAWAKRHGVTPPAFVIAAAQREGCCDQQHAKACCSSATCSDEALACATRSRCSKETDSIASGATEPSSKTCPHCTKGQELTSPTPQCDAGEDEGMVLLVAKLRCSGLTLSLSLLPPFVVAQPVAVTSDFRMRYEHSLPPALLYEPPYLAVAAPPPDALCT